jgi:esterase/lipase
MKKLIAVVIVLLILIYSFGPNPKTPVYTSQLPKIALAGKLLDNWVTKRDQRPDVKPGNQSVLIWADSTMQPTPYALLYLHGYTASPVEGMPVFPDFAAKYGCNAYAPRLAYHGLDTPDVMINYNAETLWQSAVEALAVAKKMGQKVIVMSTSTGGTLAIKLAAEFPDDVHALINLSPNIRPKPWNAYLLNKPWGLQIARLTLGSDFRYVNKTDTVYEKYWYTEYRIESLVQLQELVETTMRAETFEKVKCPTLNLCYFKNKNKQDDVVSVDRIIWMHSLLGTPEGAKVFTPIPTAETHVIGNGIYSKGIAEVEAAIDLFSQQQLNLKPLTLAP